MPQLQLFDMQTRCHYCGNDPGSKRGSPLWNGFHDRDMDRKVCWGCQKRHYEEKRTTEFANMYSEFPISLFTTELKPINVK